jgi:hypothetical protein
MPNGMMTNDNDKFGFVGRILRGSQSKTQLRNRYQFAKPADLSKAGSVSPSHRCAHNLAHPDLTACHLSGMLRRRYQSTK